MISLSTLKTSSRKQSHYHFNGLVVKVKNILKIVKSSKDANEY